MGNIGIIVNSEEMYELADRLSRKTFKKAKVILSHSYEDSIMWAHKLEREGYQILISRGGHGERIRASGVNLPVIDIPVSSINVMSPFVHAIRKGGKIAVIGNQYLLDLAKDLAKDFNCDILCYHVDTFGDFERYVASAKAAGAVSVIGGYHAVYFAEAAGLNSFCVEMRELEFEVAMEEALKVQKILEEEKRWNELFRTILDSIQDGVISVNNTGAITHINSRAQIILGMDKRNAIGQEIKEPSIKKNLDLVLREGKIAKNELDAENNYKYISSIKPITVDKETVGGVVILQEVKSIQKMERQIREQLFNRGLVAQNRFEDILGTSKILREAIEKAKQYSLVDSTILICGESGTGKEIFAQSIHNNSLRSKEAFVAINCAAISQNLLESELFGYVDGAFTGAKRGGKIGLFEVAHNGTIFLDEIGETSLDMQTRLLRVLEERRIRRIGDDKVIPVNIRIIAATNKDLRAMVKNKEFREDFYYRLNVLSLNLPPLRERKEDLLPLIRHFQMHFSKIHHVPVTSILPDGVHILMEYNWPGNVRELRNVMERLAVLNQFNDIGAREVISVLGDIPKGEYTEDFPLPEPSNLKLIEKSEHEVIGQALRDFKGNKTEAAKHLGISRATLYRKLREMEEIS